jgi:hypothetical protein
MKCPCCKTDLIAVDEDNYESLIEHVECREPTKKIGYGCPNTSCDTHDAIRWTDDGELYWIQYDTHIKFINSNMAPFGTLSRRLNVEIYKCGVKRRSRMLSLGRWDIWFEYCYKSNENGDVLKWWPKLQVCYDGRLQISAIRMIMFSVSQANAVSKCGLNVSNANEMFANNCPTVPNRSMWRVVAFGITKLLHPKFYKLFKNQNATK